MYNSLKDGGIFLNADKIVNTNQEEFSAIEYYNNNVNIKPHIDTPLSIEHEIELLKNVGFKNITVFKVDKEDYRLFKVYK